MQQCEAWSDGMAVSRFLDTTGDGTGNIYMNVDGSVTPQYFKATCRPGYRTYLRQLIGHMWDKGKLNSGGFGTGNALTNGMMFGIHDPVSGFGWLTYQHPMRRNVDFGSYGYNIQVHSWGKGDESLLFLLDLDSAAISYSITGGQSFVVAIRDDLTKLNGLLTWGGLIEVPEQYVRS